jgi:hypothetical protein
MGIETSPVLSYSGGYKRKRFPTPLKPHKRAMVLDKRPTTLLISNLPQELREASILMDHFKVTNIIIMKA